MNVSSNNSIEGAPIGARTDKAGICVKGNLATKHLDKSCNGINIVIPFNDAAYIPLLLQELRFEGNGPEIDVVELFENEELFDIKAMIKTIEEKKKNAPMKLKKKNRNHENETL